MTRTDAKQIVILSKTFSARALAEFVARMRPDLLEELGWTRAQAMGSSLFGTDLIHAAEKERS